MLSLIKYLLCSSAILLSIAYEELLQDPANCKQGYENQDGVCQDINECYRALKPCGDHSQCINLEGTYKCECNEGYRDPTLNGMRCEPDLTFTENKEKKKYLILGISGACAVVLILILVACYWRSRQWKKRAEEAKEQKWDMYAFDSDDDTDSSS